MKAREKMLAETSGGSWITVIPLLRNAHFLGEPDTFMKSKFFSIFFHWVPGAVRLLGSGFIPKRVLFLQKKRSKRKLGGALLC